MLNLLKGVTPCEWLDVSNPCEGILCAVLALRNRRENETGSKTGDCYIFSVHPFPALRSVDSSGFCAICTKLVIIP